MGKTAKGAVWLNADMLSPFEYWQFWRNTDDADVISYMKIFTDFTPEQIGEFSKLGGSALNGAKIALADAATSMCHGAESLPDIHAQTKAAFGAGSDTDLPIKWVESNLIDIPTIETLLVVAGLCASKGEAKRLAQGGGLRLNGEQVTDARADISIQALLETPLKISLGKKHHYLVQLK
jgi:tyrosyl-tRNA synthetase